MNLGFDSYGERFSFELYEISDASEENRREWFEWWLTRTTFDCERCEAEFTPDLAMVEEDSEFLCPPCAAVESAENRTTR